MNPYKRYLERLLNLSFIEIGSSFIGYRIDNESCFIGEVFVNEDERGNGLVQKMVSEVEEIARNNNCKEVYGQIQQANPDKNAVLKASYKCKYDVRAWDENTLEIYRELV